MRTLIPLASTLLLLGRFIPAQNTEAIQVPTWSTGVVHATPVQLDGPDVPAPPRDLAASPHPHGMPAVPVGPPTWSPPPGPPTAMNGGVAVPALAPVQVYRNTVVKPSGASTSNVGEPSTCKLLGGTNVLQTGNWYAARSTNNGSSWSYVNPYTLFGAIDGGFCCDQVCINHEAAGITVWLLQYSFSATTNRGSILLGVGVGDAGTGAPGFGYRLDPQFAGFPAGTWFDFPHIATSARFVFVAGNVFNAAGTNVGSLIFRLDAGVMRTGNSVGVGFARSDSATPANMRFGAARFALGYSDPATMYFAAHANTTTLRIFSWPDSGSLTARDRAIGTWYSGRTAAPGPDSRDWLGRIDNRIQGGFQSPVTGQMGWMWTSNAGGSFPRMFTRMVRFDSGFNLLTENSIWHRDYVWAYGSVTPSSVGHIAGTLLVGGGTGYPQAAVWMFDDLNNCGFGSVMDTVNYTGGNFGPDGGRSGDYTWSQYVNGNRWITCGMAQVGGPANANSEPHNAEFGRQDTSFPSTLTLNLQSTPVTGASFALDRSDYNCQKDGSTNASRVFRSGTAVQVTAAATVGSRQFYRWRVNGTAQAVGQRTVSVTMSAAATIVADYGTYTAGRFATYGAGCAGSNGVPSQTAGATLPELGLRPTYNLANGPRNGGVVLVEGFSRTQWAGIPLPLRLPSTTCDILTELVITYSAATNASGQASLQLTVPNDANLIGFEYYTQWWCIDLFANPYSLTVSNGEASTIGGWRFN